MRHIRQQLVAMAEHHHNVEYISVGSPDVWQRLMDRGVSQDGIGITRRDAHRVTTLSDWLDSPTPVAFDALVDVSEFRYLRSIDLRQTRRSVIF